MAFGGGQAPPDFDLFARPSFAPRLAFVGRGRIGDHETLTRGGSQAFWSKSPMPKNTIPPIQ
jgi:hypothetical protein